MDQIDELYKDYVGVFLGGRRSVLASVQQAGDLLSGALAADDQPGQATCEQAKEYRSWWWDETAGA